MPRSSAAGFFTSMIDNAGTIYEIPHMKKIEGYESYYRIKMGDYRLGMEAVSNREVIFLRFLHRKDIYRYFPKRS
jgi:mRNA interferase RelE/StbE